MKSNIKDVGPKEDSYPCLKEYRYGDSFFVVFFTKVSTGVIVHGSGSGNAFGTYRETWDMRCFKPFEGVLELCN